MWLYSFQVPLGDTAGDAVTHDGPEKYVLFISFSISEDDGSACGVDAEVLLASAYGDRSSQSRSVPLHLAVVLERRVRTLLARDSKFKLRQATQTLTSTAADRLPKTASAGGLRVQEKRASAQRLNRLQAEEEAASALVQRTVSEDLIKALRLYHLRFPRWHLGDLSETASSTVGPAMSHPFPLLAEAERAIRDDAATAASAPSAAAGRLAIPLASTGVDTIPSEPSSPWAEKYGPASPSRRPQQQQATATTTTEDSFGLSVPWSPLRPVSAAPASSRSGMGMGIGLVSRELLHARLHRDGYRGYLASSSSFEQRKLRLALVMSALEHSDYHTAQSVAGNEYSMGPFYNDKVRASNGGYGLRDRFKGAEVDHLHSHPHAHVHAAASRGGEPPAAETVASGFAFPVAPK